MNDKMLDIIGLADEKYVSEAGEQRRIKHHRRFSARLVAVVAAAVCLTSVGAFAAYKGIINRDSVSTIYDSSAIDSMEDKGYAVGKVLENEHFRLTIEAVLRDEFSLRVVMTAETLDDAAKKYMEENAMISTSTFYGTGKQIDTGDTFQAYGENKKENVYTMAIQKFYKEYDGTVLIDENEPLKFEFANETWNHKGNYDPLFSGLSFMVNRPNTAKSTELFSSDGNKIKISEFSCIVYNAEDPIKSQPKELKVFYKDGTSQDLTEFSSMFSFITRDADGKELKERTNLSNFITLIDPDQIDHVVFDGTTYSRK